MAKIYPSNAPLRAAIALTAYAEEVDQEHSLEAGYQHHINKPIVIPELIEIITELVRG